jgi:hypothetical protein
MKKILLYLLELTFEKLVQKTGQKAMVSGLYRSGDEIIPLSKSERFPPSEDNVWNLVISV